MSEGLSPPFVRPLLTLYNKNIISHKKANIMICDNCKIDRLVTDFINNQKFCYHCEYQIKIQKTPENRKSKPKICRICEKDIIYDYSLRKRQRNVFCSYECAEIGHNDQINKHWTRKFTK